MTNPIPITQHPEFAIHKTSKHFPWAYSYYANEDTITFTRIGNVVTMSGSQPISTGNYPFLGAAGGGALGGYIPYGYRPIDCACATISGSNAFLAINPDGSVYLNGNITEPTDRGSVIFGAWLTEDELSSNYGSSGKYSYSPGYQYSKDRGVTKVHFPYARSSDTFTLVRLGQFVYVGGWGWVPTLPEAHHNVLNEHIPKGYRPYNSDMGLINVNGLRYSLKAMPNGNIQADGAGGTNEWYHVTGLWITRDSSYYL